MGFFSWLANVLSLKIKWQNKKNEFVKGISQSGCVKLNTQIVVAERQSVFIITNKYKLCDIFESGEYVLSGATLPIASKQCKLYKATKNRFSNKLEYPNRFKGSLVFASLESIMLQAKTKSLICYSNKYGKLKYEFEYSFLFTLKNVKNFAKFVAERKIKISDTSYKNAIICVLNEYINLSINKSTIDVSSITAPYDFIKEAILRNMDDAFEQYGLTISNFDIQKLMLSKFSKRKVNKRNETALDYAFDEVNQNMTLHEIDDDLTDCTNVYNLPNLENEDIQNYSINTASRVDVQAPYDEQNDNSVFCYKCGTKLIDGADFCHKCGAKKMDNEQ